VFLFYICFKHSYANKSKTCCDDVFGIYLINHFINNAIAINNKSGAGGTHIFFTIHVFLYPNAVSFNNAVVGIGYQGKGQFVFGLEFFVRFFIINTYTYYLKPLLNDW
jgi:hypothetical protein